MKLHSERAGLPSGAVNQGVTADDLDGFTWPPLSPRDSDNRDAFEESVKPTAVPAPANDQPAPRQRRDLSIPVERFARWRRRDVALALLTALVLIQGVFIVWQVSRPRAASRPAAVAQNASGGMNIPAAAPAVKPSDTTVTAQGAPAPATTAADASGELSITSNPTGASVVVDGRARGTTPARIIGLAAGAHRVVLSRDGVTVTETVTVAANARVSMIVPFNSGAQTGWISVVLPIEVQIFENGRLLGVSQSERILVQSGPHRFDLVNESVGFRATQQVTVAPGAVTRVTAPVPKGMLSVNAAPWAEVFVDGERVGETPLANVPLTIGSHEVVFRHPELPAQTRTVVVSAAAPARLSVAMKR